MGAVPDSDKLLMPGDFSARVGYYKSIVDAWWKWCFGLSWPDCMHMRRLRLEKTSWANQPAIIHSRTHGFSRRDNIMAVEYTLTGTRCGIYSTVV